MSAGYKINPVKATYFKHRDDMGIQGMNDTCFNVCAVYSGTTNTFDMDPNCTKACTDMVEQRRYELFGVGSCDHQAPYHPVVWNQTPRYVPELLRSGLKPVEAKETCLRLCQEKVPNLTAQCQENCLVDFSAIEEFKMVENRPTKSTSTSTPVAPVPHMNKNVKIILPLAILLVFLVVLAFLMRK